MIELIYVVYKNSKSKNTQHPYNPLYSNVFDTGVVYLEPTLPNTVEVKQNWINKESKIYNNKRSEAEKNEFYYSILEASEVELESEE